MNDLERPYLSRRWDDALYHDGIKGMHWYVKRYQNADRTWTEEGKIRYGRAAQKRRKAAKENQSNGVRKSGAVDSISKMYLKRNFNIADDVDLKNTKIKDIDQTKLTPKHDKNRNDTIMYLANLGLDLVSPMGLAYLPYDLYRGGQAIAGSIKSKKYQKERDSKPIDKKTGFHLKTEDLSVEEDLKRVNPEVNDFNSNTKSNCVLCTMTCEMRRRGYDVTANKAGMGYMDHELKRFFKGYKMEHIESAGTDPKSIFKQNLTGDKQFAKKVIDKIERTQPEGSRGNLSIAWGGIPGLNGGHSMYYEIKNGKMIVYDGQTGKIYSDPTKILKNCSSVDIGRLDNLQFDPKGIKECCK